MSLLLAMLLYPMLTSSSIVRTNQELAVLVHRNLLTVAPLHQKTPGEASPAGQASSAAAATSAENPWNGTWVLDASRSTPGSKDQAAESYRFTLRPDGQIKWEIPTLGEVVTGKTDGAPMEIHRTEPSPGLTLSVTAEGPEVLIYKVAHNGKPAGEGRMTLVENGKAWVDISWPAGQPQYAGELVYVKQ